MQMQWKILQPDRNRVENIRRCLNCHPIIATILANRQITTPEEAAEFILPSLNTLPAPTDLLGVDVAARRIHTALVRKEKILVFGDYDADGVTATALLVGFLQSAGADVHAYLPHRISEGYGLQPKHITQLAVPRKINLIITVDCGSSSHDAVTAARRFGIDVIVTDHHNIDNPPDAYAVINPKSPQQPALLADLAGVGVAFYLTIGLRKLLRERGWWDHYQEPNLIALCDLVAVGSIADMVPLIGVNRVLVKTGLTQMNTAIRPGMEALRSICDIRQGAISSDDVAFRLAPRINAAGRMDHAKIAFDLLYAATIDAAHKKAQILHHLNHRRQTIERQIFHQIIKRLENRPDMMKHKSFLLADENWHQGVLGIVAAKLAARYHRPVILVATQDGIGKGSGRSVPQLDLYEAINQCADLLDRYGGHRLAAGLTVQTRNIRKLQKAFEAAVTSLKPSNDHGPQLVIDSELNFDEITPQLINELARLEPFGTDNPAPIFVARDVRVVSAGIVGGCHRRMVLRQTSNTAPPIDAIQFNLSPDSPRAKSFEHIAFRLQWNRYKGKKKIQMVVEGF